MHDQSKMGEANLSGQLRDVWRVYTERPVLIVMALGFSSGLPLVLTGSTLALWMADEGVDLGTIGLFSLVGLPYVLKFLWAPLVDAVRVPFLSRLLGRRRGWLMATQLALVVAIALMGLVDPLRAPGLMALAAITVAFLSATQDIAIDAFRVETLKENQQAAGVANFVAAYQVAMRLVAGVGTVAAVSVFGSLGAAPDTVWSWAYGLTALFMGVGLIASLLAREPDVSASIEAAQDNLSFATRFNQAVVSPFADFVQKRGWLSLLAFVVLFKFGDAFAGAMVAPFALDIGFEKTIYISVANGVGLPAALAGGFAGGMLGRLVTMKTALWTAGILQMVSNLVFCWQAWVGPDATALGVTVGIEAFTSGFGTVIFVAFLSSLCVTREFTATQFALLTALAAVGRTILSASAGFAAAAIGWVPFFLLTTLAAVPGLLFLVWLGRQNLLDGANPLRAAGKA
ncbi:MAG: MFS transporter [Rhodobiaceae bacterium]|nr:MAG: MFS transporter [Rhodobiaceae bacterium]